MPATLTQLAAVRSRAGDSVWGYLDAVVRELSRNRLLKKFGRTLDDKPLPDGSTATGIRMSLKCEPFDREEDEERARQREQFSGDLEDDEREGGDKPGADACAYMRRRGPDDDDHDGTPARARPEPLDEEVRPLEMAFIIGDPGSGKSEFLKHQAVLAAQSELDELKSGKKLPEETHPPIFVRLPDLGRALESEGDPKRFETALAALLEAVRLKVPELHGFALEHLRRLWTDEALQKGGTRPLLLCLDAWDEVVSDADRAALISAINALAERAAARILATSRAVGYQPGLLPLPAGTAEQKSRRRCELRVLDFDWAVTEAFFRKFFATDTATADKFIADLRAKPQIHALAANPLMATLLASVFGPRASGRTRLSLPARRTEVYREVAYELLVEPSVRKEDGAARLVSDPVIQAKLDLLSALALRFFPDEIILQSEAEEFADTWLADQERRTLRKRLEHETERHGCVHILEVLSQRDSVLTACASKDGPAFMFLHLTLEEFFAARYAAAAVNAAEKLEPGSGFGSAQVPVGPARTPVPVQALVDHRCESPRWREVMCLLAGQLKDAEPMLSQIESGTPLITPKGLRRSHDLVHWRLCVAAECLAETGPQSRGPHPDCAADRITQQVWELWRQHRDFRFLAARRSLAWVAQANGRLNPGIRLLEHIGAILADPAASYEIQWEAREAMRYIGAAAGTDEMLRAMRVILCDSHASDPARSNAAHAVGAIGVAAGTSEIVGALAAIIGNPSASFLVRAAAMQAAGKIGVVAGRPEILAALATVLRERGGDLMLTAAESVRGFGAQACTSEILCAFGEFFTIPCNPPHSLVASFQGALYYILAASSRQQRFAVLEALRRDPSIPGNLRFKVGELVNSTEIILAAPGEMRWCAAPAVDRSGAAEASDEVLRALPSMLADDTPYVREAAALDLVSLASAAARAGDSKHFAALLTTVAEGWARMGSRPHGETFHHLIRRLVRLARFFPLKPGETLVWRSVPDLARLPHEQ